jgi:hypothetical protein
MSPSNDPTVLDASLHLLADHLLAQLAAGAFEPAVLHVSVTGTEGFDLGVLLLDGNHPSELLVGFTAPDDWHALGVATGGWAYHVAERGTAERRRTRVDVVTLLSRSGELAHRTHVHGDEALSRLIDGAGEQPTGEQVDLLRLALGLPTADPPRDTSVYWANQWLSALLDPGAGHPTDWNGAFERHPAIATIRHHREVVDLMARLGDDDLDVVAVASGFARACDWAQLRTMSSEGRFALPDLDAEDADWFDDGAFARFVLNRCPPLAMLRREVADALPAAVAERVDAVLDRLGIPESAWPDDADHRAA